LLHAHRVIGGVQHLVVGQCAFIARIVHYHRIRWRHRPSWWHRTIAVSMCSLSSHLCGIAFIAVIPTTSFGSDLHPFCGAGHSLLVIALMRHRLTSVRWLRLTSVRWLHLYSVSSHSLRLYLLPLFGSGHHTFGGAGRRIRAVIVSLIRSCQSHGIILASQWCIGCVHLRSFLCRSSHCLCGLRNNVRS